MHMRYILYNDNVYKGCLLVMPLVSANIYIYWNGTEGSIPAGWTCQSCTTGIDFIATSIGQQGIYPKISNTYCGSNGDSACGGSMSHTHTYSSTRTDETGSINGRLAGLQNGVNAAGQHVHLSLNVSTTLANTSVPPSYGILILKAIDSAENTIPAKGIIMFNSTTAPTGFSLFTLADGLFFLPGVDGTQGTLMGQSTNNHSNQYVRTGFPSSGVTLGGTKASTATTTHTHNVGNLNHTDSANHIPEFVDIPFIYTTTDTIIPVGAILMSNNTNNWSVEWTKQNYSTWLNKYIRANSTSFNTTGGNPTHNHTRVILGVTGEGSAGVSRNAGTVSAATQAHTHSWVNVSVSNANNNPKYTNITLFRLDIALSVTSDCWTISGKSLKAGVSCLFFKLGGLFGL